MLRHDVEFVTESQSGLDRWIVFTKRINVFSLFSNDHCNAERPFRVGHWTDHQHSSPGEMLLPVRAVLLHSLRLVRSHVGRERSWAWREQSVKIESHCDLVNNSRGAMYAKSL